MGNAESDRRTATLEKYKDILPSDAKKWYYQNFKVYLEKQLKRNVNPWNDSKFLKLLNKENGTVPDTEEGKFCRWKEIQKEIFDAVIEHHQYDYYYPWEEHAESLLKTSTKTKQFENIDCNQIDTVEKQHKVSKEKACSFNTTDLSSCLPERRKDLYMEGIKSNIDQIENFMDRNMSIDVVESLFLGSVVSSLTNKAKNEIQKLKSIGKTDAYICKIMKRNIADYKDLFLGKDIVANNYSKNLQCRLEKIRKYINRGKNDMEYSNLLDNKIRKIVQNVLDGLIDEDGNKCTLYNMSNADFQCLRFLEEWFEHFLKKKQNIQNNIIHTCVNKKSKTVTLIGERKGEMTCDAYCKGYELFLQKGRSCYNIYLKKCKENIAKLAKIDANIAQAQIDYMLKNIKKKTKCPDYICGDDYKPDLFPYFNPNDSHFFDKGYICGCEKNKNNTNKYNAKKFIHDNYNVYKADGHDTKLETILNELSLCSMNDDDLDGTIGGKGEKVVTTNGSVKDICGVTYGDSFIRKSNLGNPCWNYNIDNKKWICDGTPRNDGTLLREWKNNACMSPRTRVLCLGFLCNQANGKNYHDAAKVIDSSQKLLTEMLIAAKYEGENLKNYFKSRQHQPYGDHNLCNALKYSFSDLGDMIRGRSIWGNIYTIQMERNLKAIFDKLYNKLPTQKKGIYNDNTKIYYYLRETWWNTNREYIWRALLCGAQINGDRCGDAVPNIDYMPQFLRWMTEWYEDYCYSKKTLYQDVVTTCKKVDDKNFQCDNKDCDDKCEAYTTFMNERKEQWEKQNQYYSTKKTNGSTGVNNNLYTERDAKEYLKTHISFTCGDQSSGTNTVEKNITALTTSSSSYYDADSHCGCKKYIDESEYTKISGESNCTGLQNEAKTGKDIKWRNKKDSGYDYLDKRKVPEEVYLPPRKQKLCFQGLDGQRNGVKDKNKLRVQLLKVAATEGYNLGQYYKNKNEKKNGAEAKKYSYDVLPCSALKYSFLDLRDIILGYDMTEPKGHGTEDNLIKIFTNGSQPNNTDRKQWWNDHKKCVWNAMKCGYQKGRDETLTNCDKDPPSETEYPIGNDRTSGTHLQFLRWFTEWGEDFCKHYTRELGNLSTACPTDTCDKNGKQQACKEQCEKYQKFIQEWKGQYEKQSKKFNDDKDKFKEDTDAKPSNHAYEYLNKKIKKMCSTSGPSGSTDCNCMTNVSKQSRKDMPKSLDETPESVKNKCDCAKPSPGVPTGARSLDGGKPPKPMPNPNPNHNGGEPQVAKQECKIDQYITTNDGTNIGTNEKPKKPCNKKEDTTWKCGDQHKDLVTDKEVCVPPRRQKMCIKYLTLLGNSDNTDKLKEELIKSVSLETYFLWEQYKTKNSSEAAQLQNGTIPEEFKRQMFYTLGDFRDLILDKDILHKKRGSDTQKAREKIDKILKPNGGKDERESWWDGIEEEVWTAMVCALSYSGGTDEDSRKQVKQKLDEQNKYDKVTFDTSGTKLSTFVKRPQFLRWMTEWGENFCRQYTTELEKLEAGCKEYECNGNNGNKGKCDAACKTYQEFINKWKGNYEKQNGKFKKEKDKEDYKKYDNDVKTSEDARQYLQKKLTNMKCTKSGTTASCNYTCMDTASTQNGGNMPKSLDETPDIVVGKCPCTAKPAPAKPVATKKPPCTGHKILDAANIKQREAKTQMETNSIDKGGSGESKLKGNIQNAEFGTKKEKLENGNICDLDKSKHTNDWRQYQPGASTKDTDKHDGPCTGKGRDRFVIGKKWDKKDKEVKPGHTDVLIPPRRLDMCTSNLENLASKSGEPQLLSRDNVNDSFLGDVLLAAKEEGHMITLLHGGNTSGICNAMKYSFADLGDIIRGRDMWEKNEGMAQLEKHLQAIFKKIWEQNGIKDKYTNDDKATPPYTQLRSDWWSANRDQIWKAMTCDAPETANLFIPSSDPKKFKWHHYKCGRDKYDPPPDDYIPQRLRWMTEWTENYCRQLEKNYWWANFNCAACKKYIEKEKQQHENMTQERKDICKRCVSMCTVYGDHVKNWQSQWKEMETKYKELQQTNGAAGNDEIKKEHEEFFKKLKGEHTKLCEGGNQDTKTYQNLSDYVSSMGGGTYCNDTSQTKFNEENDEAHVFKENPKGYNDACSWTDPHKNKPKGSEPEPKTKPNQDDACEIVKKILDKKNPTDNIDNCNQKYNPQTPNVKYPDWKCDDKQKTSVPGNGECMPPRRKKLCVHNLTTLNVGENELREAFIKCAAKETFLHWQYYKEYGRGKNKKELLEKQLQSGIIPADFKRQMVFTYGDYRDLCLGKDKNSDVENARKNIENVFKNGGNVDETEREKWWEKNKEDIWKGMVCGLSYHISKDDEKERETLTDKPEYKFETDKFDEGMGPNVFYIEQTPQFLRWFTEWSDEFCEKQKEQLVLLHSKCDKCKVDGSSSSGGKTKCENKDVCDKCKNQCQAYKKFITEWGKHYKQQKDKYDKEKKSDTYDEVPLVERNTPAYTYLNQSLEVLGLHGDCMKQKSSQTKPSGGDSMPQSLDTYPPPYEDFEKKCDCQDEEKKPQESSKNSSKDSSVPAKATGATQGGAGRSQSSVNNKDSVGQSSNASDGKPKGKGGKKKGKPRKVQGSRWVKRSGGRAKGSKPATTPIVKSDTKTVNGGSLTTTISYTPSTSPEPDDPDATTSMSDDDDDDDDDDVDDDDDDDGTASGTSQGTGGVDASDPISGVSSSQGVDANTQPDAVSTSSASSSTGAGDPTLSASSSTSSEPQTNPNGGSTASPVASVSAGVSQSTQSLTPATKQDTKTEPKMITKPKDPLNCVDEAAYYLSKEAENALVDVKSKLKEKIEPIDCTNENNNSPTNNSCDLKIPVLCEKYGRRKNPCGNKRENCFNVNTEWQCYRNLSLYKEKKGVCVPPRRENMYTKPLEYMKTSTITTTDILFNVVLRTAAYEGKHLKEHWENIQDGKKKKYELCDAMKYSFADLGDIVRGTDMLLPNGRIPPVERKLKEVFMKLFQDWKKTNSNNNKYPDVTSFRSAWWDANRNHFWKAMTCFAPDEFQLFKRLKGESSTHLTQVLDRCGHKYDPPVNDYIPQRLRWLTEWSENYCKAKKEKLEILKELCKKCARSGSSCEGDDIDGTQCEECKKTCKEYKNFVKLWQQQFETQSTKYNELYEKANKNSGSFNRVSATYGNTRNPITLQDYDNKRTYNFLKKVKEKCDEKAKTAEQYLDKTTKCIPYKFTKIHGAARYNDNYAFNEKPPNGYEIACECKAPDPLEQCPKDKDVYDKACKNVSAKNILCHRKTFKDDLDNWNSYLVREWSGKNKGVLIPPRRRHLCTSVISSGIDRKMEYNNFMNKFLSAAYTEGLLLAKKYPGDNNEALQAMKYSFYDYGDIIKGTDLMDTTITTYIKTKLENLLKNPQNTTQPKNVNDWWKHNKKKVWNSMLCGYKSQNNNNGQLDQTWCPVPSDDTTPQFLRWFTEWSQNFCTRRQELETEVKIKCTDATCDNGNIDPQNCESACKNYKNFILTKENEYKSLKDHYDEKHKSKNGNNNMEAHDYLKSKCNGKCLSEKFNSENKWEKPYESITDQTLKDKCDCKKIENKNKALESPAAAQEKKKDNKVEQQTSPSTPPAPGYRSTNSSIPPSQNPVDPPQNYETFNTDILSPTLPLGISVALGSIALLYYLKKKPKLGPTDIFRVLDIPQNDYGMPDKTSTNRYVPYASRYKGKTYLYVEGEETDDYIRDISSTDITSSSESEYDEVDINDIYPYKSPKYKTLIEVVLKPSNKTYDAENTHIDNIVDTSDTTTKKLTDNEWNELKQDFISNMLQNDNMDIANENPPGNICMDSQPDTMDNRFGEKPFITQIQDRDLHNGIEEVTYNIEWNVPENINRTTNNLDDQKYVSSNDKYSGIDLINDSLNNDQHVDIYDELLKRKENELFGTKHLKNTTTNSVVKETYSDPILNQLDLYDKWLDRHRDMCNQWNNKEEMLHKLNEEWNNEHNEHILDIPLNDNDINKNNDENYNMISTNIHQGNDKISLEDFG
ncbi:erythrocyte membrane protein 1, PfEMP1, putative [Plasmodium sp. DRC-Itaito]|nr:erythrocyte membrane protein 1, PfEMP1, putative [Plasmodium sp. DRC-Itaito]